MLNIVFLIESKLKCFFSRLVKLQNLKRGFHFEISFLSRLSPLGFLFVVFQYFEIQAVNMLLQPYMNRLPRVFKSRISMPLTSGKCC